MKIKEYIKKNGESPYRKWLNSLDLKSKARIEARIFRFETGNLGDVKSVGNNIFEARFFFGSGYRLYFGKCNEELILLLIGGDKNSQIKDIKIAQEYWSDYESSQ